MILGLSGNSVAQEKNFPSYNSLLKHAYIFLLTDADTLINNHGIFPVIIKGTHLFLDYQTLRDHFITYEDKKVILCVPFSMLQHAMLIKENPEQRRSLNLPPPFTLELKSPLVLNEASNKTVLFCDTAYRSTLSQYLPKTHVQSFIKKLNRDLYQELCNALTSERIGAWFLQFQNERSIRAKLGKKFYRSICLEDFFHHLTFHEKGKTPWLKIIQTVTVTQAAPISMIPRKEQDLINNEELPLTKEEEEAFVGASLLSILTNPIEEEAVLDPALARHSRIFPLASLRQTGISSVWGCGPSSNLW